MTNIYSQVQASQVALVVKNLSANARDIRGMGLIPERSPREGNGNALKYSCLENSMDRGAWWAIVYGVTKSRTRLIYFTFFHNGKSDRFYFRGLQNHCRW